MSFFVDKEVGFKKEGLVYKVEGEVDKMVWGKGSKSGLKLGFQIHI